jgi:RNA polymerase sigma-70 factor (ECF subfamily)
MRERANEEALMEAYVAGDAGAFERLFRSLAPSLRAFFTRSVGQGAVAEDLVQTTFLRLHAARRSWRTGERLRPWAFTIAARVRVDWHRSRGRPEQELDEAEGVADPDPAADPAEAIVTEERAERVRAALDRLPEPQRVVVHLHRLEGMTFAEIGRVLGISEGAAKLRAFRAYAQLRSHLADLVSEEAR